MKKYVCKIAYEDGYANYSVGDVMEIGWLKGCGANGIWVHPDGGHPIQLEAFQFCFEALEEEV